MAEEARISELHKRLQQLEDEVAERHDKLSKAGSLQPHHTREAEKISSQAGAMRAKLTSAKEGDWHSMKHEVEAEGPRSWARSNGGCATSTRITGPESN